MPFLPRHLNMPPLGVASVQAFAIDELLASLGGHMAHPATASHKRWRYKCFGFQKLAGESVQPKCQGHRNKHYGLMTWQDISRTYQKQHVCFCLFTSSIKHHSQTTKIKITAACNDIRIKLLDLIIQLVVRKESDVVNLKIERPNKNPSNDPFFLGKPWDFGINSEIHPFLLLKKSLFEP